MAGIVVAQDPGLTSLDIGDPSKFSPPTQVISLGGNDYQVTTAGSDIWGKEDAFNFVYKKLSGEVDVKVRVTRLDFSGQYAKAGLMIRENLTKGSRWLRVNVIPGDSGQGTFWYNTAFRYGQDGNTADVFPNYTYQSGPDAWMRITRSGNVFTTYYSADGIDWWLLAERQVLENFPAEVYVGLCTVSQNEGFTTTAEYKDLSFTPDTTGPVLKSALADGSMNTVYLTFSEHVNATDASNPANYVIRDDRGRSIAVQTARLNNGTQVVLGTGPQQNGLTYTVTPGNIRDAAEPANFVQPGTQASFLASRLVKGVVKREFYMNRPGWLLPELKTDPKFPLQPDIVDFATSLEGPGDPAEFYGERISGYLLPPDTGNYHFFIAGDDESELWLSTDDSPANIRLIAREPYWNSYCAWTTYFNRNPMAPENQSWTTFPDGIYFEAGKKYYFQILMKQGEGPSHVAATWLRPGEYYVWDGYPEPIQSEFLAYAPTAEPVFTIQGAGQLQSAPGSLIADPSVSGPATFAFQAEHQNKVNSPKVPIGFVNLNFAAGKLNFRSTSLASLVISGPKAQCKGTGTMNGRETCSFVLTVNDGGIPGGAGADQVRLILHQGDRVIYDNLPEQEWVVNGFDDYNEPYQWWYDYGWAYPNFWWDYIDSQNNNASGSMVVGAWFDSGYYGSENQFGITRSLGGADQRAFTKLRFDLKVDPWSAVSSAGDGSSGYLTVALRSGWEWTWSPQYGGLMFGSDQWQRIEVPLSALPNQDSDPRELYKMQALTFAVRGGPDINLTGWIAFWIDNIVLVRDVPVLKVEDLHNTRMQPPISGAIQLQVR